MWLRTTITVQSTIFYNTDKSIQQIKLKINGHLNYENSNYRLQNITQTIEY